MHRDWNSRANNKNAELLLGYSIEGTQLRALKWGYSIAYPNLIGNT